MQRLNNTGRWWSLPFLLIGSVLLTFMSYIVLTLLTGMIYIALSLKFVPLLFIWSKMKCSIVANSISKKYKLLISNKKCDMQPQNYEIITRMVSRDGQFGQLPENGFDVAAIANVFSKGEVTIDNKFEVMVDLLSLLKNANKNSDFIQGSNVFPVSSKGAARLVSVVLALIPVHRRQAYLTEVSRIDAADGVIGDDLDQAEMQAVVELSIAELSNLVPKKHSKFLLILQGIIPYILPMLFKRKI